MPSLPGAEANLFETAALLVADAFGLVASSAAPQWGIFLDGEAVVLADNVLSVSYRQDFEISNYPVEQGSFGSYNKVQKPFDIRIRFSRGGSVSDRQEFLDSLQSIIGDTNLYDVVTPEATYTNVNLIHQDYDRMASKGLGLIVVDIGCQEVRPAALASSSTTTSTSSANPNTGSQTPNQVVSGDFAAIDNPQSASASPQVNGGQAPVGASVPTPAESNFVFGGT